MNEGQASQETFTEAQIQTAIEQWLEFGEDMYRDGHQLGYFSGSGWAARCLRAHLTALKSDASPSTIPRIGRSY